MGYLRNQEFRRELALSQKRGEMTPRFVDMALSLANYYYRARRWNLTPDEVELIMSRYSLRLVKHWHKLDERNPMSYLKQHANGAALDELRRLKHRRKIQRTVEQVAYEHRDLVWRVDINEGDYGEEDDQKEKDDG